MTAGARQRTARRGWTARAAVAAVAAAATLLPAVASTPASAGIYPRQQAENWPAADAYQWTNGADPFAANDDVAGHVGQLAAKDKTGPNVGEVFYVDVVLQHRAKTATTYQVDVALQLPSGLSLVTSSAYPRFCYQQYSAGQSWYRVYTGVAPTGCQGTATSSSAHPGSTFVGTYQLGSSTSWEIQLPVTSTKALSATSLLTAHLDAKAGSTTSLDRSVGLFVTGTVFRTGTTRTAPANAVPVRGDFDGNGIDDILWYRAGNASDPVWLGTAGGSYTAGPTASVSGTYRPVAGDFDGDGKGDILWFNPSGTDTLWRGSGGGRFVVGPRPALDGDFRPVAGDVNKDGLDDIYWYAPASTDRLWLGQTVGTFASQASPPSIASGATVLMDDFTGDGRADLFAYFPNAADRLIVAPSGGTTFYDVKAPDASSGFRPVAGDVNGDANADIFLYGPGAKAERLWLGRNDATFAGAAAPSITSTYVPIAGRFDAGGTTDVLLYTPSTGRTPVWFGV